MKRLKNSKCPKNYPCSVLLALMNDTKLRYVPCSHKVSMGLCNAKMGECIETTLNRGEFYIMHPLLVHGGSSYLTRNIRVHFSPFDNMKTLEKSTYFMPEDTINSSEVETIMFGSTCNNIILSGGTFSWLIGFLAVKSEKIFYPEIKEKWFGDIFSFTNWNRIQS